MQRYRCEKRGNTVSPAQVQSALDGLHSLYARQQSIAHVRRRMRDQFKNVIQVAASLFRTTLDAEGNKA